MNKDEQRTKGIELAKAAGAAKTLAAISDKDACYEDIFKAALAEVARMPWSRGFCRALPSGRRLPCARTRCAGILAPTAVRS